LKPIYNQKKKKKPLKIHTRAALKSHFGRGETLRRGFPAGRKIKRSENERSVGEREIEEEEDMRGVEERKKVIFIFRKSESKKYYLNDIEILRKSIVRCFWIGNQKVVL
jgi:hypothetical protein